MANSICIFALLAVLIGTYECSINTKLPFKYATAFMFNANEKEMGKNQLFITSYLSNTYVLVTVGKTAFKQALSMQSGQSVTVEIPPDTELRGTGKHPKTVMIHSNKHITVLCSNHKKNSVETSLVYPAIKLGKEYYVFTPSATGYPKELAVFALQDSTPVTVELKCTVIFEGKTYKSNEKLTATISAHEVLYLESNEDCTGSRVVSDKPVGVISGHACAWKNSKCQHVFEQLLPVKQWGMSYIVPPLEYQKLQDSVFVFASQPTRFTYQFGPKSQIAVLKAGQWKEIPIGRSPPLVISSNQPIQVLYYCNGGKFSDGSEFDPFVMNIVPTENFCESQTLEGMEGFNNYALIVAKTKDINKVHFDDKHPTFNWEHIHETEYSWAHYTYQKGRGHHTLKSPCAPIGVYSVGTMNQNSYGAPAACGLLVCTHNCQHFPPGKPFWGDTGCTKLCDCDPSTGFFSCKTSQCKPEEGCKVIDGAGQCVAKPLHAEKPPPGELTCTHNGKIRLPGKPFWDDSNCTELCQCNSATGVVSCLKFQCKPEEECKVIDGAGQCVAKPLPAEKPPPGDLTCTHKGKIRLPGKPFWDDSNCTELCQCNSATGVVSCLKSQCKPEEECKVIDGAGQCVAKPLPAEKPPPGELTCTHKGTIRLPGKLFWDDSNCTELCQCNSATGVVSCLKFKCKPEEECKVIDGAGQCVARLAPTPPPGDLTCTHKGKIRLPGKPFWDDSNCTELCQCNSATGVVNCLKSQCKPEEECKVIDGAGQCVAKPLPAEKPPPGELTCTHKGKIRLPGKPFWDDSNCTELCQCNSATGVVNCLKSQCKPEEECKVIDGAGQCVARSADLSPAYYPFEYITVYMLNFNSRLLSYNELYIVSYQPHTHVVITINKSNFRRELYLQNPKSETVKVPPESEMKGTGIYSKTVIVRSNKFITIVSANQKRNSLDISLVYPVTDWGQEYFVFTPSARGYPKELAVFSGTDATSVIVELKCYVTFRGVMYKPFDKLAVRLGALETLYLESNQDCTGSRVVSDKPVGVISGHACAWKNSRCQHVFEQLLPVEKWGKSYIVLPLNYQVLVDSVYVFASKFTRVTYQFGASSQDIDLSVGQWIEIPISRGPPLVISSTQPIQVLYLCNGGMLSDGSAFDPFLMNIIPTEKFSQAYTLEGLDGFKNYALIVAKTNDIQEVRFDDDLRTFSWAQIIGTEYSWTQYNYGNSRGYHILMHPTAPIGVYSVGTANQNSYGAPAAHGLLTCTHNGQYHPPGKPFWENIACKKLCVCEPSTRLVVCRESSCGAGRECKVVEGTIKCVEKPTQTTTPTPTSKDSSTANVCHLLPSGGFHSFDGLEDRVWLEGTYSLVVAAPSAPIAFSISAKLNLFTCEPAVTFSSLTYSDLKIVVKKDWTVLVNGQAVSLPFRTFTGLYIMKTDVSVVVTHSSGVTLNYCPSGKVSVTLSKAFRSKVVGLCGNFNGQASDDLMLRDGSIADDFGKFYKDWRI